MKTILIWYLVTIGYNGSLIWSPPMLTDAECVRIQKVVGNGKCIQINEVVK